MTADEMMAFAKNVANGGEFTKKEAVAFCKALTAETSAPAESATLSVEPTATTQASAPVAAPTTPVASPFVRVTAQGAVHVQVAQFFTKREAKTLANAISYAAEH